MKKIIKLILGILSGLVLTYIIILIVGFTLHLIIPYEPSLYIHFDDDIVSYGEWNDPISIGSRQPDPISHNVTGNIYCGLMGTWKIEVYYNDVIGTIPYGWWKPQPSFLMNYWHFIPNSNWYNYNSTDNLLFKYDGIGEFALDEFNLNEVK